MWLSLYNLKTSQKILNKNKINCIKNVLNTGNNLKIEKHGVINLSSVEWNYGLKQTQ